MLNENDTDNANEYNDDNNYNDNDNGSAWKTFMMITTITTTRMVTTISDEKEQKLF